MNEWYTAQKVAKLLGMTVQGVNKKARVENWRTKKKDFGKGNEYHINSLPAETRAYLMREQSSEDPIIQAAKLAVAKIDLQERIDKKMLENNLAQGVKDYLALEGIADFINSLKLSELSTLTPEQRLQEAKGQYGTALLKAQANDADAIAQLPELAKNYLEEARGYYASGTEYAAIFDNVVSVLGDITGLNFDANDAVQQATDAANASMTSSLQTLDDILGGFVDSLSSAFDQILAGVTLPEVTAGLGGGNVGLQDSTAYDALVTAQQDAMDAYTGHKAITQTKGADPEAKKAAKASLKGDKLAVDIAGVKLDNYNYWHELGNESNALKSIDDLAVYLDLIEKSKDRKTYDKAQRQAFIDNAKKMLYENGGTLRYRAAGGWTQGPTVINEAGPELINFARPALITNNQQTQSIIALGNQEAVTELRAQTRELEALVRLQQASINALLQRLDEGNAHTANLSRKARLESAA